MISMIRENYVDYSSKIIWIFIKQSWERLENGDNTIRQQLYGTYLNKKEEQIQQNYDTERN